jgi:hypothetical protein
MMDKLKPCPLGPNPKLNELMFLVATTAASESGNGYDQAVIKKHADRAAKRWEEHVARTEPSTVEGLVEDAAKTVYASMQWAARKAEKGTPPDWVERGNSLAQSEARGAARAIVIASGLLREIEELRALLGRIHACRIDGRNGRFVNLARLKPAMDELNAALSRPLVGGDNPKP